MSRSTVTNLSQHNIIEDENRVLSFGPKTIPKENIMSSTPQPSLMK